MASKSKNQLFTVSIVDKKNDTEENREIIKRINRCLSFYEDEIKIYIESKLDELL